MVRMLQNHGRTRMLYTVRSLLLFGALSLAASAGSQLPASAGDLLIQGSTTFNSTLMAPYKAEIESAAGQKLTVVPNKSSVGLLALFEGRADLAMISATLESEIALLRKANPNLPFDRLHGFLISETRAAFAVNPANSLRATNSAAIRGILLGEINNWRALGGADLPIKVVMLREGGGIQASLQSALLDGQQIKPHDLMLVGMAEQVAEVVAREPGALGLAQLGIVKKKSLPELATDRAVNQQLLMVSLDAPTPAKRAVIDAAVTVAKKRLK